MAEANLNPLFTETFLEGDLIIDNGSNVILHELFVSASDLVFIEDGGLLYFV